MPIVATYLICACVWGTTWFAIRVSIGPDGYPTFAAAALRFAFAAVLLAGLWALGFARPAPRSRRQFGWLAVAGVLNAVSYSLVYLAEQDIPGGLAAVLFGTFPLWTALFAALSRTERATGSQISGSAVALVGVVVIFHDRIGVSSAQAIGVAFVLASVVSSAASMVVIKRSANEVHPIGAATIFIAVTAALLWLVYLLSTPDPLPWPPPRSATIAVLYLAAFGSVVAFACYFYLLKRVSIMATTTLVFVQPVIALIVDALWETQVRVATATYAGAGITLAGVMLSLLSPQLRQARRRRRRESRYGVKTGE